MSTTREIKTKINSVKNTQKITRAMELVAASKMRKAQDRMATSRPYATKIRRVISHVAQANAEFCHPYMAAREEVKRVGFVIITSDRGLCGGLNINLFRKALNEMNRFEESGVKVDLSIIGRKGESFFGRHGGHILASTSGLGDAPLVNDLIGVVQVMLKRFDAGELDKIYICANEFVNTMVQKPFARQLLPLDASISEKQDVEEDTHWDYIYEPDSSKDLLTKLLVRYIESQVYQAVVENIACEQGARMVAMKNATDNAKEIIKELQQAFNKARQAGITREIAEIVAGAAAVE